MKLANIVMDESRNSFLIDFDLAQIDSPAFVSLAARGTHQFMAPEVRMRLFAGPAADIYSLGVTLRRVWNWQTPFQASDKLSSLIDRMTMADRSKRPYPSQVFKVRSRSLKKRSYASREPEINSAAPRKQKERKITKLLSESQLLQAKTVINDENSFVRINSQLCIQ